MSIPFQERDTKRVGQRGQSTLGAKYDLDALLRQADMPGAGEECPLILTWEVASIDGPSEDFTVNLSQLYQNGVRDAPLVRLKRSRQPPGPGKIRVSNATLTHALCWSIHDWSQGKTPRSVKENLSVLRWFYQFVQEYSNIHGALLPETFSDVANALRRLDRTIGVTFAEWLRHQKLGDARRNSIYICAKYFLETATRSTLWRSSPFSSSAPSEAAGSDFEISQQQAGALTAMCRSVLRSFKEQRRRVLLQRKQGDENVASDLRELLVQLQEGVGLTKRELSPIAREVLPTQDVVCATFLLALLRLGVNEQPLLDIGGKWHVPSPLGADHRLIVLRKKRAGKSKKLAAATSAQPSRILLPSKRQPQYHPYQLLRYLERLQAPLKASLARAGRTVVSEQEIKHLTSLQSKLWLFVDRSGLCYSLNDSNSHRIINQFIARHACKYPELIGEDGSPLRYSARALRDVFFEFVTKTSHADRVTGQIELSHGPQSNAIHNYLSKRWAKRHAKQQMGEWQGAIFELLADPDEDLAPRALRERVETGRSQPRNLAAPIAVPMRYVGKRVRHGLYCHDPDHPPPQIHVLRSSDDSCPAESCFDCPFARCFDASLPELARDILNLELQRDQSDQSLWNGSDAEQLSTKLRELFERWPEKKRVAAMSKAQHMDVPLFPFVPR